MLRLLLPSTIALACLLSSPSSVAAQHVDAGRFSLHGYATIGWAATDGPQHYGITERGSADFRYAALQARYDRGANALMVQLNHRQLGESPIGDFEDPVRLNWAFYQRRFGGTGAVKLGRAPVPRGIFNEQRSAGVLLPLYRQPVVFYDEAAYYSETIDGGVASYAFRQGEPWSVDVHAYGGSWKLLAYESTDEQYAVSRVKATNAVGAQVWLHLPVEGLRVGAAAQRYDWRNMSGDAEAFQEEMGVEEAHGSIDFVRERGFARAEAQIQRFPDDDFVPWYVQAGVNVTPALTLVGQFEKASDRNQRYEPSWPTNIDWHRSTTVGVRYAFRPSLVVKLEHHWDKGIQVEQPADPLSAPRFRYAIASISASF